MGSLRIHLVKDQPNGPFTHFGRKAFPVVHPDILSRKEVSWIPGAVHKADCRGDDKGEDESGQVRGPVFNDFPICL